MKMAPASQPVSLRSGEDRVLTAFAASSALAKPKGAISGAVFFDANGNGRQDAKEKGLAGWRVFIDGREGWICRVDGMFLGTIVDAGRRRVEFRYVPPGWSAVRAAAGIGVVAVSGLLFWPPRKRPRRRFRA